MAAGREVVEILEAEGRAFVLFTATRRCARSGDRRNVSRYPILVSGHRAPIAIAPAVPSTPHAVLFATSSFWQGVDVMGEALSCVIIDKLPFASPGDPNARASSRRAGAATRSAYLGAARDSGRCFRAWARLIRHRDDRRRTRHRGPAPPDR